MIHDSSGAALFRATQWPAEFKQAGELLAKALQFAEAQRCSRWDFALELCELREIGLSRCELRYLVDEGFLEHAEEIPTSPKGERRFRPTGRLTFADRSCFVLTNLGCVAVEQMVETKSAGDGKENQLRGLSAVHNADGNKPGRSARAASNVKPLWVPNERRLSFGDLLVKQYRTHALNQHLVLAAFQEEGWRDQIDDPLPPVNQIEPKRRLHDTIAGLNRNQINYVLHFFGIGSGRSVGWLAKDSEKRMSAGN